jgi:antitoxin component YwqK of YwqJK toxin-antitoxin module
MRKKIGFIPLYIIFAVLIISCTSNVKVKEEHKATMVRDTQYVLDRVKFDRTPIKGGFNSNGLKSGLWFKDFEAKYYQNGKEDGVYVSYDPRTGRLACIGEYKNGVASGTWYFFDGQALAYKVENITKNNDVTAYFGPYKLPFIPDHKCHITVYYPSGSISADGLAVFKGNDFNSEHQEMRCGNWKYYDTDGKLEKTETEIPTYKEDE